MEYFMPKPSRNRVFKWTTYLKHSPNQTLYKKLFNFNFIIKRFSSPSLLAILVVVKSLLSISINWSVTTRYYLIFEVINCQREHISEINFDIVKYTAYVWSTRGCHRGVGGGATVAWWPRGGKAWWREGGIVARRRRRWLRHAATWVRESRCLRRETVYCG